MRKSRKEYKRLWVKRNPDKIKGYYLKYKEHKRVWGNAWRRRNPERMSAYKFVYRDKIKMIVFKYYSKGKVECAKCGFDNIDALCLDHINNNGAEHRKDLKISSRGNNSGFNTYEAIKKAGFSKGLQVLCANCNLIKEIERKRAIRLKNPFYRERIGKGGDVL